MLNFDKMKIISTINDIDDIDGNVFIANMQGHKLLYYKYLQSSPFTLLILVDYLKNELVLEFTSKILLNDYKDLINVESIKQCLNEINKLGICTLNVDNIMLHGYVVKCDITKDVPSGNFHEIISQIRQNLSNYRKWICRDYANGVVLENAVKTKKYKKRLIVYDKEKELQKATNNDFLNAVTNKEDLLNSFKGVVRFELNVNTMAQIRSLLQIETTSLAAVLLSTANPILEVVNQAIKESVPQIQCDSLRDYEHSLLLKECGNDLVAVEAKVRGLISKQTPIKRVMQPYVELYQRLKGVSCVGMDIRTLVS